MSKEKAKPDGKWGKLQYGAKEPPKETDKILVLIQEKELMLKTPDISKEDLALKEKEIWDAIYRRRVRIASK